MPKLRNDLTLLLSSKKASDLISTEGKEKLAQEIMEKMNGVLDPAGKGKNRDGPIRGRVIHLVHHSISRNERRFPLPG
jgi:flagellar FliL protein